MTDATKTEPTANPPEGDEAAEKHFWDEHATRTEAILDKWFEKKRGELGSSRTGGRATLPKIFADIVFGPEKK